NRRNPVAHANPTAPAFLSQTFLFFDENKKWTRIKISDVLTTIPLGYNYLPGAGLSKSVPRFTQLKFDPGTGLIQVADEDKAALAPTALVANRELVVEDAVLPTKTGLYNIFVGDPPPGNADQSTAPNYLGYIGLI